MFGFLFFSFMEEVGDSGEGDNDVVDPSDDRSVRDEVGWTEVVEESEGNQDVGKCFFQGKKEKKGYRYFLIKKVLEARAAPSMKMYAL